MYHANLLASFAAFLTGIPVLWNVRQSLYDLGYEKRSSAMVIRALAWLSLHPRSILYNSALSAAQHEAIGYSAGATVIVPNGIDTQRFQPDSAARESVRQELGLPADAILVGRVGRNTAMKDFPCLMEAAAKLPHLHFITAGTDTQLLPAQKNVHHLGERHDLPRLTAAFDIACSSSAFGEGFPNVLAEAMACGVPCVATDIGDSAWLLQDASLVVPARDAEALAAKLAEVAALPAEERAALGRKLRERIIQSFALPSVVRQFAEIFA
jgi:glycosyltransferase involved in cell wall biosynthesis